MCRVLEIQRRGFYTWLNRPKSKRAIEDKRLLGQIKQFWIESGFAYGYRNITKDMKDAGEACGHNRVHRIMKAAGIRSQRGYKRHPGFKGGKISHVAPNILERQFEVDEPNKVWVTDFTYVRTYEGWLYLTIVLDLFSRQIIGWSMKNNPRADLVIDALLMAIWRRKYASDAKITRADMRDSAVRAKTFAGSSTNAKSEFSGSMMMRMAGV